MPAHKKYNVKLRVPSPFLSTLPDFPVPKPKTRVKKLADEKKAGSPTSSPAPDDSAPKVNTGPKELSTAGLAVNSVTRALDKTGTPCRRWTKGQRQFKTFSGFKVKLKTWKQKRETKQDVEVPKEEPAAVAV